MQIIIVGCGKVGRTLAEQLQEEESDITLIDVSSNVITSLQNDIDAMGIVGNGASINTLVEAGIENADILIAVTGSDEMNLPDRTENRPLPDDCPCPQSYLCQRDQLHQEASGCYYDH